MVMHSLRYLLASLGVASLAACVSGKQPPPAAPPTIKAFTASKTSLRTGETVTLSWETTGADTLSLLDSLGNEQPLTPPEAGTVELTPAASAFYVLRASGPGGRDTAFVQVAVETSLSEVFLVAIPSEVDSGQPIDLIWSAFGGSGITIKDAQGASIAITGQSGVARVQPKRGTTYTLSATSTASATLTATATVKVRPVIVSFTATPAVAKGGDTITLDWQTSGFDAVTLEEATFGAIAVPSTTEKGKQAWLVPSTFAGGADGGSQPIPNGYPLTFTLKADVVSPAYSARQVIHGAIGEGAWIETFKVPANATEGKPVPVSWTTRNATRVELLADGMPLFQPPAGTQTNGAFALPPLKADTTVALVVYDAAGFSSSSEKKIVLIKPPKAVTFTVPAVVTGPGVGATMSWTTENARRVVIRVKDGPLVFTTTTSADVAAGSTQLYPARDTTYVLEAYNVAGETSTLEKATKVSSPVMATVAPEPIVPGTSVSFSWDLMGQNATELIGMPTMAVPVPAASTAFVDLSQSMNAQTLSFPDVNDGVAALKPGEGFTFPFLGRPYSSFTLSTNGFLALALVTAQPTNVNLTTSTSTTPVLAPFWDDLSLQDGALLWELQGDAFPRQLIIQWNKARLQGDMASELTFQVQLFENGQVRFVYKKLSDTHGVAGGQNATIGISAGVDSWIGQLSFNPMSATVAEGQELLWFNGAPQAGMLTQKVREPSSFGFFFKTAGSNWAHLSYPIRVFTPATVQITEVMPVSPTAAPAGTWVELFNPANVPLDISGLRLVSSSAADAGHVFPPGTTIPPSSYWVVGESKAASDNGEAPVSATWGAGEVTFTTSDTVSLKVPLTSPITLSALTWAGAPAGVSTQREAGVGTSGPLMCARTSMFGTLGAIGTPGQVNESCFEYSVSAVAPAFEDISAGGAKVFTVTTIDDEIAAVTLTNPFRYFGADYTTLTVSSNGWAGFGTYTSSYSSNKTAPSTTSPVGVLAPFWDDLANSSLFPDANVYVARVGDHTIVQWHHFSVWNSPRNDDINFEMKLFDNGNIEFHYANLMDRASSGTSRGSSATVWIERPAGTGAAPVALNSPVLTPYSAWRFTPKP